MAQDSDSWIELEVEEYRQLLRKAASQPGFWGTVTRAINIRDGRPQTFEETSKRTGKFATA